MNKEKTELRAINNFFGKNSKRLNCYQSVLEAFSEEFDIFDKEIEDGISFGRGNAKDGECGAVYAVRYILNKIKNPEKVDEFLNSFIKTLGSTKCLELKSKKVSCDKSIKNAVNIFIDILNS